MANARSGEAPAGAPQRSLSRRGNVLLAQHHRQHGWSIAQIAHLLDRAPATVRGYLHDPTGAKAKARKASYAGTCERCGAPTSGADGKGRASPHCQRCKPQSRARWTRETVRGAHRFWRERFGFTASSLDWSGTHARRRGGAALARYRGARWPSQSVIRRLYGTPAAARADAFGPEAIPDRPQTHGCGSREPPRRTPGVRGGPPENARARRAAHRQDAGDPESPLVHDPAHRDL